MPPRPIDLTNAARVMALREGARNAAALAVVAVVALAAAANAVFGGHPAPAPVATPHAQARPAPAAPMPPRGALHGELWYADDACRLHRIDLSNGRDRTLTAAPGRCNFWVSPDRRLVALRSGRPLIPPQPLELLDVRTGRITAPFRRPDLAFAPPAWSPDSRTLVTCDGSHGVPRLYAFHVPDGRITPSVPDACFPGYVGDRLVYRDIDGLIHVGARPLAGAGSLATLLRRRMDQNPGPATAGAVIAVPATTVTIAGGPAPITIVVVYDRAGRPIGEWDTGAIADAVTLLAGGSVIVASRSAGLLVDDRSTSHVLTNAAGRPITAAAVSPDRSTLALSTGREIIFTDTAGRPRWSLPLHSGWMQWTP